MTHALPRTTVDRYRAPARAVHGVRAGVRLLSPKLRSIRASLLWFVPVLAVTALVRVTNIVGAPQRTEAEGAMVAHAYALDRFGGLAPYSSWYDQQPFGWLQLAGWARLTGGFGDTVDPLTTARVLMVGVGLVSTVLVWLAARRLGVSRPGSAAAVAVFGLTPLAIEYQRTAYAENLAVCWLLVALVAVLTRPRPRLAPELTAAAIAGTALALAVASNELSLIAVPVLVWQTWRSRLRSPRRVRLAAAGALVGVGALVLLLITVLIDRSLPGSDRVGLFAGLDAQVRGTGVGGGLLDPNGQAGAVAAHWWSLDPVLLVAAPVAALAALAHRRFWPYASAVLLVAALVALRTGELRASTVIMLLPSAAVLIPAAVEIWLARALRHRAATVPRRAVRSVALTTRRLLAPVPAVAVITAAAVGVVVAVPLWGGQVRSQLRTDQELPIRQAVLWLDQNVDRDQRLVVDSGLWSDLVQAGFPVTGVIPSVVDGRDPAATTAFGWRDSDFVVSTASMRTATDLSPTVSDALANSVPVASFGAGAGAVEVSRVHPEGAAQAADEARAEQAARADIGTELAGNPALQLPTDVADLFRAGKVDPRLLLTLPQVAGVSSGRLAVTALPPVFGETTAQSGSDDASSSGSLRRQAWLAAVDGQVLDATNPETAQIVQLFRGQSPRFRPRTIDQRPDGVLITYGIDAPTGLLQAAE